MNQKVTFPEFDNTFLLLKRMSFLALRLIDGEDVEDEVFGILRKMEFIDENFEWIYDDAD